MAFRKLATRVQDLGKKVALIAVAFVTTAVGLGLGPGSSVDAQAQDKVVAEGTREVQQTEKTSEVFV